MAPLDAALYRSIPGPDETRGWGGVQDGPPRGLPRPLAYGSSAGEAMAKAEAFRVLAERLELGEAFAVDIRISLPAAA